MLYIRKGFELLYARSLSSKTTAEQLFMEILQEIDELRQNASHTKIEDFLYPLAQQCEEKYGLSSYLICLINNKIYELNPLDHSLKKGWLKTCLLMDTLVKLRFLKALKNC